METSRDEVTAVDVEGAAQKNDQDAHAADAGSAISEPIEVKPLIKELRGSAIDDAEKLETEIETRQALILSELCKRFITEVLIVKDEGFYRVDLIESIYNMESTGLINYLNALSEKLWMVFEDTGAILLENPLDKVNMYSAKPSEKAALRHDMLIGDPWLGMSGLSTLLGRMPDNVRHALNVLESLTVELQKLYETLL